jgi:hypothetical protein
VSSMVGRVSQSTLSAFVVTRCLAADRKEAQTTAELDALE